MSLTRTASDTLAHVDDFLVAGGPALQIADSIGLNWSDFVARIIKYSLPEFKDKFLFTDDLQAQFLHRLAFGDVNNLADALRITASFLLDNFADQFTQTDAAVNSAGAQLTISISDNANNFSDSIGDFNSTSLIAYLRRYLGDVPR